MLSRTFTLILPSCYLILFRNLYNFFSMPRGEIPIFGLPEKARQAINRGLNNLADVAEHLELVKYLEEGNCDTILIDGP